MKRSVWCVLVCMILTMPLILSDCTGGGAKPISVTLSTGATSALDDGQTLNITATVTNDTAGKGVTWALSGPGSLTGQTSTAVTYKTPSAPIISRVNGRPATITSPATATVTATSVANAMKSAPVTITVNPPPSITTTSLPAGTVGAGYSQPLAATGGSGTLTWGLASGSGPLPAGLTLASATGIISGTPTGPASATPVAFTVQVTDSSSGTGGGLSAMQALSILINNPPAPKISPAGGALPAGTEGTAYSQTITVNNGLGPFTWTVTLGSLPAGLTGTPSSNTFKISGTPTGPNVTSNFTLKVTDSSNPTQSDTQSFSITINLPPPPKISPTGGALPNGTEGTAYSQQFTVSANTGFAPFTWTVIGTLPAGLTSSQSAGGATFKISGTPTGPNTTSNFSIKVTDSSNPAQNDLQNYSITINLPPAPKITPTGGALPNGTEGAAYSQQLTVTTGTGLGPFTWLVVGTLPAGLTGAPSADTRSFLISGTPTGPNITTNFSLKVTDSSNPQQSDLQNYSITINLPPPPSISPASGALPNGNVGSPYSQTFTVTGGLGPTFTWSESGTLPAGLTFNPTTGTTSTITGTPTAAVTNDAFSIQVKDSSSPQQTATANYTLTIMPPAPFSITTTTLPNGNFNQAYNATISATGGIAPYTFSLDATSSPLPSGLTFSSSSNQGVISGTPTTAGTFGNIIVDAHDSQTPTAATAQKTYTLVINAPALIITTSSLPNGTQNQAYNATINGSGGVQPYTFSVDAAGTQLPTGLSLTSSSNQGVISGTPTVSGTFNNIIIDLKDSEMPAKTTQMTFSLTINTSGALTCPLPAGGNEALLNGTYAARFHGWGDPSTAFNATASFTAGGTGNITSLVADTNAVGQTPQNLSGTGCFSVGADLRGNMIWNFGGTPVVFAISVRSDGHKGKMIEFDDTTGTSGTRGSGEFRKQDTTVFSASTLSGPFAFGIIGWDGNPNRTGVVGVLSFNGSSSITSGSADFSTKGTSFDNLSVTGSFTAPDATHGRGTITLTITGVPVIGTITETAAYYIEKAGQAFIQTTNMPDTTGHFAGNGLAVLQTGGPFSAASSNAPAVFSLTGFDVSHNGTNTSIGMITSTGNGNFTGVIDNNSDLAQSDKTITGTITMMSNGLGVVTVTNLGPNFTPISVAMAAPNAAFLLEGTQAVPGNDVSAGILLPQTAPSGGFSGSSISGNFFFGSDEPATPQVGVESGVVTITNPNLTVTQDQSGTGGLQSGKVQGPMPYTMAANGRGVVTSSGGGTSIIWLISTHQAVVMDTSQQSGTGSTTIINVEQ